MNKFEKFEKVTRIVELIMYISAIFYIILQTVFVILVMKGLI